MRKTKKSGQFIFLEFLKDKLRNGDFSGKRAKEVRRIFWDWLAEKNKRTNDFLFHVTRID